MAIEDDRSLEWFYGKPVTFPGYEDSAQLEEIQVNPPCVGRATNRIVLCSIVFQPPPL